MVFELSLGRFYGIDTIVELLIVIVSSIIAYSSYRIYKLIKDDKYKLFSFAFIFIAISFIFKILSNLTILHHVRIEKANFVFFIVSQLKYMQLINFLSFNLYKFFHIIGFLFLLLIVTESLKREKIFLFIYLSLITVLFSVYFNFIFHITLVIILFYLAVHFYDNYHNKKSIHTFLVFIAFFIMLVSHLMFAFSEINSIFYLIGEILLLISFANLLLNQLKLKNKKNNKYIKKTHLSYPKVFSLFVGFLGCSEMLMGISDIKKIKR